MERIIDAVRAANRVLVTTHVHPDGDGIGSQIALHLALTSLGKTSLPVNADPIPEKFTFLDPGGRVKTLAETGSLGSIDLAIVVDTNDWAMLGAMEPVVRKAARVFFVDHHEPEAGQAECHAIDPSCHATGEIILGMLRELGVAVDREIATAIYTAMITDASTFRFRSGSPEFYTALGELLGCGVSTEEVFRRIYAQDSVGKVRLLGHVLTGIETSCDGRIAVLRIDEPARKRFGATVEDTHAFIDHLTRVQGVEIGAVFREDPGGWVKLSLRGIGVPVLELARGFGGGGHRFAAGARIRGTMDDVVARVTRALAAGLGGETPGDTD